MRITASVFMILFPAVLLLLHGCLWDDTVQEIYFEGEPIPGIEIFFPLGFYDAEPLMPKISPDGKKLLFTGPAALPEWKGLWVMDLKTQEKTLLHPNGSLGDWAPDSEWIVFNIGTQIYKIRINGAGLTQLTFEGRNFLPDWNPVGDSIAFSGDTHVTIINLNGDIIKLLEGAGGFPDWNSGGTNVIGFKGFSSTSIWKKLTVYDLTMNKVTDILDAATNQDNRFPKYSPNDEWITFQNDGGICIMNTDNSIVKRIIPSQLHGGQHRDNPKIYSAYPSWHPDGEHIIYEHFEITLSKRAIDATHVEGHIRFYKVNASDALAVSNLK